MDHRVCLFQGSQSIKWTIESDFWQKVKPFCQMDLQPFITPPTFQSLSDNRIGICRGKGMGYLGDIGICMVVCNWYHTRYWVSLLPEGPGTCRGCTSMSSTSPSRLKSLIPKEFPNKNLGIDTPSMGYYHLVSEDDRIHVVEIWSSGLWCSICGKKKHIAENCFKKSMGIISANAVQLVIEDLREDWTECGFHHRSLYGVYYTQMAHARV